MECVVISDVKLAVLITYLVKLKVKTFTYLFKDEATLVPACNKEDQVSLFPCVWQSVSCRRSKRIVEFHKVLSAIDRKPESFLVVAS